MKDTPAFLKIIKGRLYKRAPGGKEVPAESKAAGVYWVQYAVNGNRVRHRLVDPMTGKPPKDLRDAERLLQVVVQPLAARDELARLEGIRGAMKTAEERLADAVDAARPRLLIAEAWERHPYEYTRRGSFKRKMPPSSIAEARCSWNKFVTWCEKNHPDVHCMEDVTPVVCQEYSDWIIKENHLTAGRHNRLLAIASIMFRSASIPDPFKDVPRHAARHESRANLSSDELKNVCSTVTGELRTLLAIGLYAGLRLKDAVLLKWENIHSGQRIVKEMAKTKKTVAFPVHPVLAAILQETPEAKRKGYIIPKLAEQYQHIPSYISLLVRKHFENNKIITVEEGEGRGRAVSRRGFHSLRHTFITLCAQGGVPLDIVREWVGHSSVEITRIYRHYAPNEGHDKILKALDMALPAGAAIFGKFPAALPAASADVEANAEGSRQPLPLWAQKLITGMNADNWHSMKTVLLNGQSDQPPCPAV